MYDVDISFMSILNSISSFNVRDSIYSKCISFLAENTRFSSIIWLFWRLSFRRYSHMMGCSVDSGLIQIFLGLNKCLQFCVILTEFSTTICLIMPPNLFSLREWGKANIYSFYFHQKIPWDRLYIWKRV